MARTKFKAGDRVCVSPTWPNEWFAQGKVYTVAPDGTVKDDSGFPEWYPNSAPCVFIPAPAESEGHTSAAVEYLKERLHTLLDGNSVANLSEDALPRFWEIISLLEFVYDIHVGITTMLTFAPMKGTP